MGAPARGTPRTASPDLHRRIVRDGERSWHLVFTPCRRRDLRREELLELLRRAEAEVGGSFEAIARHRRAEGKYRKLVHFLRNYDLRP